MGLDPLTERGRQTRERLVRSAATLFAERTVHAVGLNDVLASAGASKSQLYHYFESKDDLVRAVIDHQQRQIVEAGHGPLLDQVASWEDLAGWLEAVVALQRSQGWRGGCRLGSLASALSESDEAARVALVGCFDGWRQRIASALVRLQHAGLLRPEADPERLALATLTSLQGGLLLSQLSRSEEPLRVALDAAYVHVRCWASTEARGP
jgi:TetR/AcrR family transcriptional repressor of nem operon